MRIARKIFVFLGYLFFALQFLGYIGANGLPDPGTDGTNALAFYIGFHFPAIFGAIAFTLAWYFQRRMKRKALESAIASIGIPQEVEEEN